MKYIIEEHQFIHIVDWDKLNTIEGDFVEEYFPTPKESIEAFLRLLESVHSAKAIAEALAEGLNAMDYSKKGQEAKK
ncbi:MAG: hypothetical protein K6E35_08530 [Bacteroidales bacterium]|nr:hypothetical protein [Bacteroidales bacterium]